MASLAEQLNHISDTVADLLNQPRINIENLAAAEQILEKFKESIDEYRNAIFQTIDLMYEKQNKYNELLSESKKSNPDSKIHGELQQLAVDIEYIRTSIDKSEKKDSASSLEKTLQELSDKLRNAQEALNAPVPGMGMF